MPSGSVVTAFLLARAFALLGLAWAVLALAAQMGAIRRGRRRDYAVAAGNPTRGLIYNFTVAMLPGHKESIRLHPIEFAAGILLHAGIMLGLVELVLCIIRPGGAVAVPQLLWPISVLSLSAGLGLLIRRVSSPLMRFLSVPDDYLAILATCGFVAAAALLPLGGAFELAFMIYAALLLIYLPLGKLRHAVFFFVARGEYGLRLGYRGVYPPTSADAE